MTEALKPIETALKSGFIPTKMELSTFIKEYTEAVKYECYGPDCSPWSNKIVAEFMEKYSLDRADVAATPGVNQSAAEAIEIARSALSAMREFHACAESDDTEDMNPRFPANAFRKFVDEHARLAHRIASFESHPVEPAYIRLRKAADAVCAVAGCHGQIMGRDDRMTALLDAIYDTDDGLLDRDKPVYLASLQSSQTAADHIVDANKKVSAQSVAVAWLIRWPNGNEEVFMDLEVANQQAAMFRTKPVPLYPQSAAQSVRDAAFAGTEWDAYTAWVDSVNDKYPEEIHPFRAWEARAAQLHADDLEAVRDAVIEECLQACRAQRIDDPKDRDDRLRNIASEDCWRAIRALKSPPQKPVSDEVKL